MAIHQFKLESLEHLDSGKALEAFNLHIKRAALDCFDRPGDPKARKVVLQVDLEPVIDDAGECVEVKAQIHATSKVPDHKTRVYSLGLRRNGILVFNEDSLDNIYQSTLLPDDEN